MDNDEYRQYKIDQYSHEMHVEDSIKWVEEVKYEEWIDSINNK